MKTPHPSLESKLFNRAATAEAASPLATERLLAPPKSFFAPGRPQLKMVILGPANWRGEGAASTYRGLARELTLRGHDVFFLERGDGESASQKTRALEVGRVDDYLSLKDLKNRHAAAVREADFVLVASQIAEAAAIGDWITRHAQGVTAFYDFNAAQTVSALPQNRLDSITVDLMPRYDLYFSFTGGPVLDHLEDDFGVRAAYPLYPAADARHFFPEYSQTIWDFGYIGRHNEESMPVLERLLLEPARRWEEGNFVVAGSSYPRSVRWPGNVKRVPQVSPQKRRSFYNAQRFTLDITPPDFAAGGFSPGARLFEAAACGTPIITEFWPGLDTFFTPDEEILISHSPDETLIYLEEISELDRRRLGYRARERVLARHTSRHRAIELEGHVLEMLRLSAGRD